MLLLKVATKEVVCWIRELKYKQGRRKKKKRKETVVVNKLRITYTKTHTHTQVHTYICIYFCVWNIQKLCAPNNINIHMYVCVFV